MSIPLVRLGASAKLVADRLLVTCVEAVRADHRYADRIEAAMAGIQDPAALVSGLDRAMSDGKRPDGDKIFRIPEPR